MNTSFNNTASDSNKPLSYSGAQVDPVTNDQSLAGTRMESTHEPARFHNDMSNTRLHQAQDPTRFHNDQTHTANVGSHHTPLSGRMNAGQGFAEPRTNTTGGILGRDDRSSGAIHAGSDHHMTGEHLGHHGLNDQTQTSHIGTHSAGRTDPTSTAIAASTAEPRTHTSGEPMSQDVRPSGGVHTGAHHGATGGNVGHDHGHHGLSDQTQTSHIGTHSAGRTNPTSTTSATAAADPRMHTSSSSMGGETHPSSGIQAGAHHGATGGDLYHDRSSHGLSDQTQTSHVGTHSAGRMNPTSTATSATAEPRTHTSGNPLSTDVHPIDHAPAASSGAAAHQTSATHPTAAGIERPSADHMGERKPTVGEKIKGNLEKISGRMTDNPTKVAHGEELAHGAKPAGY